MRQCLCATKRRQPHSGPLKLPFGKPKVGTRHTIGPHLFCKASGGNISFLRGRASQLERMAVATTVSPRLSAALCPDAPEATGRTSEPSLFGHVMILRTLRLHRVAPL